MTTDVSQDVVRRDENADTAIKAMVGAVVGTAIIPAHVNWALTASAMGAGVIAIAKCYGQNLSKEQSWRLVKDFFLAAGAWFIAMEIGTKIMSAILTTTGLGYGAAVALDGAISGAAAYAIGRVAKEYCRRGFLHQKPLTSTEIRAEFRNAFSRKKAELKAEYKS